MSKLIAKFDSEIAMVRKESIEAKFDKANFDNKEYLDNLPFDVEVHYNNTNFQMVVILGSFTNDEALFHKDKVISILSSINNN